MNVTNKKLSSKDLQKFVDESYVDEKLQELMEEFRQTEVKTGIQDPVILSKIFDYLDAKFKDNVKLK